MAKLLCEQPTEDSESNSSHFQKVIGEIKPAGEQRLQNTAKRTDTWSLDLVAIGDRQDREAFARFFQHFAPLIKGYFLNHQGMMMSSTQADELVQEVMLKVWTKASKYKPEKSAASTWVFTMARNTRIDMLRRQSRHNTEVLETEDIWATEEEESPVAQLQVQREQSLVQEAMADLPPEQAQIVQIIYLQGKTHTVAAEELNLPLGTVKSRLRLALAKMKIQITQSADETDLLT